MLEQNGGAAQAAPAMIPTSEAALRLGLTPRQVVALVRKGELDGRRLGERNWYVNAAAVDAMLRWGGAGSAEQRRLAREIARDATALAAKALRFEALAEDVEGVAR